MGENESGPVLTPINNLVEIIKLTYSAINQDEGAARFVSEEDFLSTLRYLADKDNLAYLIVRRDRKLSKFKENGAVYSDAPDTTHDELSIARSVANRHYR